VYFLYSHGIKATDPFCLTVLERAGVVVLDVLIAVIGSSFRYPSLQISRSFQLYSIAGGIFLLVDGPFIFFVCPGW
jgi:hypothetical protein